ncbi:MAG: acetoacetate-CoA ligase [Firmicutes bacterium ZCTH02-B6]|nr:MAG: acetoacetate-CoA ligase [Firmicutes bacterium ZCTH02-B6]
MREGDLLWQPSPERQSRSTMRRYIGWLKERYGLAFADYDELWTWSVTDLESFWGSIWEFCGVQAAAPYSHVLADERMPGARWFVGAELNYAAHVFRRRPRRQPAILYRQEGGPLRSITWGELEAHAGAVAHALRELGVRPGDRVAGYIPNIPTAVVAFLACASIGAVWSSCSPDFGPQSVVERFRQIAPKVLIASDGYRYGGKPFDRLPVIRQLQESLTSVEHWVLVPYLHDRPDTRDLRGIVFWDDLLRRQVEPAPVAVPFDHPLWVLYSSGTTGPPKAIVQGHGGIVLEHLKMLMLHMDLRPGDRFFWFTTTGWMMWNFLVSGLLLGSTIILYDGNPAYPSIEALWQLAEETGMTCFGTSAAYIAACMKAGIQPGRHFALASLTQVGSTGSPLPPEGFAWVYRSVKEDVHLASISGGTDVCTAFVGGSPVLPVRAGEIQCRALGAKVEAYDQHGRSVVNQVGELVVTRPMPSMPLFFWNDPGGRRYLESYFSMYPGVWRHGDWIKITSRGSCVIYGRSDATINRGGVRMGTSEIYQAVESLPEIADSLVVDMEGLGGRSFMPLFVVLRDGYVLDASLENRIRQRLRDDVSPRHVPDAIYAVPQIPRTLNGKKLEVPVRKILLGAAPEEAVNLGSMANPESLLPFVQLARQLAESEASRAAGTAPGE